jgi:hypothetical protein
MVMNISMILGLMGAVLGFLGLILALFAIGAVRRWRRSYLSLEASLAAMRRELELATSIGLKTGRRLKRIEQECAGLGDRIEQFELRGAAPSFDQAIESARRGADPGKLSQQFGLSSSEAELVTRLHGRKKMA